MSGVDECEDYLGRKCRLHMTEMVLLLKEIRNLIQCGLIEHGMEMFNCNYK